MVFVSKVNALYTTNASYRLVTSFLASMTSTTLVYMASVFFDVATGILIRLIKELSPNT